MKKRTGSILVVLVYGAIMSVVMLGFLRLSQALMTSSKDSATIYANVQTYRSAGELCCYQYLTDIEASVVTKDLNADWLSISNRAIYTQAIEAILGVTKDPEYADTGVQWFKHDLIDTLETVNITNPEFVTDIQDVLSGGIQSFSLTVPEPLIVDPLSEKSFEIARRAYLEIQPFVVEIDMRVKGEELHDSFIVSDMFLLVQEQYQYMDEAMLEIHSIATLSFVEGEEGCHIYRASL